MALPVVGMTSKLGMDAGGFVSGLGSALGSALKFGAALTAVAIGGIAFFTKKEFEALDATAKLSRELGISSDVLRSYKLGVGLAGQEFATLETALRKLPKSIGQANQGLMTQKRAFEELGLDPEKLGLLDAEEQFIVVSEAIGKMNNASERGAVVSDIFGRSGAKLVPFFKQGRAGLEALRKESERLNGTFSDIDDAKIEEANDSALKFGTAFESIFKQIALVVAPFKENFFNLITDLTVGFREKLLPSIIDFVQNGLEKFAAFVVENGPIVALYARTIWSEFKLIGSAFMSFVVEPVGAGLKFVADALGLSGTSFKDWTGILTESMIAVKFLFENFEDVVDVAIDGSIAKLTTFSKDVLFIFTDELPAAFEFFGKSIFAEMNNAFFDVLSSAGSFVEQMFSIFANLDQLITGKVSLDDVLTSSGGLFDDSKIEVPELILPLRQKDFMELYLLEQFENSKDKLGQSFEEFRKAELAKLESDSDFLQGLFDFLAGGSSAEAREGDGLGLDRGGAGGGSGTKALTEAVERGSLKEFEILQRSSGAQETVQDKQLVEQEKANELQEEANEIAEETQVIIKDATPIQIGSFD